MRATLLTLLFCITLSSSVVGADNDAFGPGESPDHEDGRFQMLAIGGRAMLLDRETGKSWLLAARGEKAAWVPIQQLGDSSVASSWLKANLPARKPSGTTAKGGVSMKQAQRQVQLESITGSEVAAEPFSVLVARERAALNRLKSEYGDRHPQVLASRTRLRELLKLGSGEGVSKTGRKAPVTKAPVTRKAPATQSPATRRATTAPRK